MPQLVFGETFARIADGAKPPGRQIVLPADVIDDPLFDRIVKQPVDGEIAAAGVFLGGTEGDAVGMPAVAVGGVFAEGGDLDHARRLRPFDGNHAERSADRQRAMAAEKFLDLRRRGVGGHVVILGRSAEQLVAHASAGPIRREARRPQSADDFDGETALFVGIQFGHGKSIA